MLVMRNRYVPFKPKQTKRSRSLPNQLASVKHLLVFSSPPMVTANSGIIVNTSTKGKSSEKHMYKSYSSTFKFLQLLTNQI